MTSKVLLIDPFKCDGCKECETACTMRHTGYRKIARKRIEVMGTGSGDENFFVPFTCQQCVDPPCMAVCPKNAITRDLDLARVVLDTSLCVGCAMCVSACPTGSMAFAHDFGFPYKCELCDGEPQCVRVCEKKAAGVCGALQVSVVSAHNKKPPGSAALSKDGMLQKVMRGKRKRSR